MKKLTLLFGLFVVLIFACEKWDFDRAAFIQIITVGAIEVGSNDAFLLGDIDGIRNTQITETGFVLSVGFKDDQNLQLNKSGVIQVVSPSQQDTLISKDQAFAARITSLDPDTKYYFRAYAKLRGDESAYGLVDTFTTTQLIVSAVSIERTEANCMGTVKVSVNIAGARAGGNNTYGIVWSKDESTMLPILNDSNRIDASSIDLAGNFQVDFNVTCETTYFMRGFYKTGSEESYGPVMAFSMIPGGKWVATKDFPEDYQRDNCAYSWTVSNLGFAMVSNQTKTESRLWQFDPSNSSWDLKAMPPYFYSRTCPTKIEAVNLLLFYSFPDYWQYFHKNDEWLAFPLPRAAGEDYSENFRFLQNRRSYYGTGLDRATNDVHSTVWTQAIDSEFGEKLPDFPGQSRHQSTYFILNNRGYVGLGKDGKGGIYSDFWALDFDSRSWHAISDFPDTISSVVSFSMENKAYVLTGYNEKGRPIPNFYEYDPELDHWNRLADFGLSDGNADIGFAIDGVIYGGLGISNQGEARKEIWRYVEELK